MDDYGDAPEMIQREIIDPLSESEIEALLRQLDLTQFLVKAGVRIPDELILQLDILERRLGASAMQGLMVEKVEAAARKGHPKVSPTYYDKTAFHFAGEALSMEPKTIFNRWYEIQTTLAKGGALPPLANTPKRSKKK